MELTIVFEITNVSVRMDEHIICLYCSRCPVTAPIQGILEILIFVVGVLAFYVTRPFGHVEAIGSSRKCQGPHRCPHLAVINQLIDVPISCRTLM